MYVAYLNKFWYRRTKQSKRSLMKQLARRRARFAKRRAKQSKKILEPQNKDNSTKKIELTSIADLPSLQRPMTAQEEVNKIRDKFAQDQQKHERDLDRSRTRSKDKLQRLLARSRKRIGRKHRKARGLRMSALHEIDTVSAHCMNTFHLDDIFYALILATYSK